MMKVHCDFVVKELETCNAPFDKSKLNSKGKSVKVGVKCLIGVLKQSVCPNQTNESVNMTKNERLKFKSSAPTYLTSSH